MKIIKKLFNIVLIFLIIQLFGIINNTNIVYADNSTTIGDKIKNGTQSWREMSTSNSQMSQAINEATGGVQSSTEWFYDVIRRTFIAIFILIFSITMIGLNLKAVSPQFIAEHKVTIGIILVIAILFMFAREITTWITSIFEQLEGLM